MRCKLITPRALAILNSGTALRILGRFQRLVNLVDDSGRVLTISANGVPPGPFSLIIESPYFGEIEQNRPVEYNAKKHILSIGSWSIKTSQGTIWDPVPNWSQLRQKSLPFPPMPNHLPQPITTRLHALHDALLAQDLPAARTAVRAMAGLGGGLTPAGDDVLMGLIFAYWVWLPGCPTIERIAAWAAPHTTTLSAAYLRAAAAAEATQHWHHIIQKKPGALQKLLAIGHTSGQDAWVGFQQTHRLLSSNLENLRV